MFLEIDGEIDHGSGNGTGNGFGSGMCIGTTVDTSAVAVHFGCCLGVGFNSCTGETLGISTSMMVSSARDGFVVPVVGDAISRSVGRSLRGKIRKLRGSCSLHGSMQPL